MKSKEYIKTDTVIVGSGVAGVFAALCLPEDMDVLVITKEKLDEVKQKLMNGEIKVFDTNTFTVDGKKLETYKADIVDNGDFVPDSEAIKDGTFAESTFRSAPYFDIKYIDGISE